MVGKLSLIEKTKRLCKARLIKGLMSMNKNARYDLAGNYFHRLKPYKASLYSPKCSHLKDLSFSGTGRFKCLLLSCRLILLERRYKCP